MNSAAKHSCLLFLSVMVGSAAQSWQKPPKAVLDALNAPTTPTLAISPTRTHALQGQAVRYPPMSEVSQPMLRLAGQRINPKTNGLHNTTFNSSLTLRKLPEGTEIRIETPPGAKLSGGRWSPDGAHVAFTNTTAQGTELWIARTAARKDGRSQ